MSDLEVRLPSAEEQTKIVDFLDKVGLKPLDPKQPIGTPALDLTKGTKDLIAWGGAGGAGASVVGLLVTAYQDGATALKIAFVAAVALILSASALALAKVLEGDVRGRSAAAVAQYDARREILGALLKSGTPPKDTKEPKEPVASTVKRPTAAELLSALAAYETVTVKTSDGAAKVVAQRWSNPQDGLQLQLSDGDWVGADRVEAYTATHA